MNDRIIKLMDKENLTPAQFAEVVGISRSAVSHFTTGERNGQPSLTVVQKILNTFRMLNPDWLILGVGAMYRGEKQSQQLDLFTPSNENDDKQAVSLVAEAKKMYKENLPEKNITKEKPAEEQFSATILPSVATKSKIVDKIVVFYSDSTFEEFKK